MTQTLDSLIGEVESGERHVTYDALSGRNVYEAERVLDSFLSVLRRMTREERISASRHGGFTRWERWVWRCRYPEEVPLVNGELEWIACNMADLDPTSGSPLTCRRGKRHANN